MDSIIRGVVVYMFLLLVFRIAGKRSLANLTTFDFVLVLILSETVQQALIDNDNSMTSAALLVVTLVSLDVLLSYLKGLSPALDRILDSTPAVVVKDGALQHEQMKEERVDEADVLTAARERQGISRLNEIGYAVVEQSGDITVIPGRKAR